MASTQSTTRKPWDSIPTRCSSTRYVKRDQQDHAAKRPEKSGHPATASKRDRIAELPPPGPSNIVVTTASILPPPREIGSK